ncbi:MAG: hypothetical protein ACO1OQ_15935 [Rufibacter sp.]
MTARRLRHLQMSNRYFLILASLWLVSPFWANGQDFAFKTQVEPVPKAGYYRILLPPKVTGHLQPAANDLRLYDSNGQEVPYLLQTSQPLQYRTLFKPYQILRYTRKPGGMSELLIHNPGQRAINNIILVIGNADVRKVVALSGSDDQQNWFVLKEQDVLFAIQNTNATAEVKILDFPLSNYRYFRLQLNDSTSAPLNILKAGYYDTYPEEGKYSRIPVASFSRLDSAKTTYLRLNFGQPMYPERLVLHISAPHLYRRSATVVLGQQKVPERRRRKRRHRLREEAIAIPLVLSSNAPATVDLPAHRVEHITIQIINADNPPLTIDSLQVLQLNRYLVAELEPDKTYEIRFGNKEAKAPEYDLHFFQDSIPKGGPVVQVQQVMPLQKKTTGKTRGSKALIWAALAVVALGLAFMTRQLLRDMDRKKE